MRSSRKSRKVIAISLFLYLALMTCHVAGGKAAAAVTSAEDGDGIVKIALEKFGAVHVLVANAGILRDKSFTSMTEQEWDAVMAVHLRYAGFCLISCGLH